MIRALTLIAACTLAVSATAQTLIVGNKDEDTVSFIDLESGQEVRRLETGANPHEVAISPDGGAVFVVNYGTTTIDLFDVEKAEKIGTCDLAPNSRPHGIVWTQAGGVLVTTEGSRTLTLVTPDCSRASAIATDQEVSHMVAVDEARGRAYVSNLGSRTVTAIDLVEGRKIEDFTAAEEPEGLALAKDGTELWVANRASASVFVLDALTGERLADIAVGQMPIRLAVSPDQRWAVTSDLVDGAISVIDVERRERVRTIEVSGTPDARQVTLIWSADGERLYAAETGNGRIAEIDFASGDLLRYLPAGKGADGLGIAPVRILPNAQRSSPPSRGGD
ncbi:MAG: YncE family protein [Pacificimonas sp.]|jgi:YVTN family beta-propeller protein|nr:YncE family protein [Pacificimonas sp.]